MIVDLLESQYGPALLLSMLLVASAALHFTVTRRTRMELLARLAAYGEAYDWIQHHTLLTHNLAWRLFSELRHQMNVRGDAAIAQRRNKIAELEREMIRVLYDKPVLPIVQKRHLKIHEATPHEGPEPEAEE